MAERRVNITGATDASLLVRSIQVGLDDGAYTVAVSDANGTVISSAATLTSNGQEGPYFILTGTRQDYTLKGDTTYFIPSGTVTLVGNTRIEGGAVVKYAKDAATKLVISGALDLQTGPYRPAIFTAEDDDLVGWPIIYLSSGAPSGHYADVAIELPSASGINLKYLRICYANTAIHCLGTTSAEVTDTLRHIQLRNCALGIKSEGTASYARVLSLGNILMSHVDQAIGGSRFRGRAEHLTVDTCTILANDDVADGRAFYFANCVLANVTSLGSGLSFDGSNNGFYPQTTHQLGGGEIFETAAPFATTTFEYPGFGELPNPENGQGGYYLRAQSPFFDAGTPNIDAGLKNDLAQMTTAVPPPLLWQDLTTSQTLGQQAVRDQDIPDIGYHYPAVDYVISGATVNNCTLNIDSGTVLGFVGYYPWGLRVNAGGRLNVNGVPTNRVVFVQLETIHENPLKLLVPKGPMLAFRDVFFGNGDTPATPLPEARIRHADFPTVSGGFNLSLAPLTRNGNIEWPDDANHGTLGNLEVNGCLFQGGVFYYQAGGPQGRVLGITNSTFERAVVRLKTSGNYGYATQTTEYEPQLAAVNNLWYGCWMELLPVGANNNWIFTDNIFDYVTFAADWTHTYNGPIGHNDHNAYIAMTGYHLAPIRNSGSDPDVKALVYQSGPLGRFYLPQDLNGPLINRGSRPAGLAGLYHFTTSTANAKEAASTVDIGPHYLALDASGNPFDSNAGGPDGVPDFIADRNGDGSEGSDEMPWQSANNSAVAVLSPTANSVVSGTIQVQAALGAAPSAFSHITALVDDQVAPGTSGRDNAAQSIGSIEIDTSMLAPGISHTLAVVAGRGPSASNPNDQSVTSASITFTVQNPVGFADWQDRAQLLANVNLKADQSVRSYMLHFYDSSYPKAMDPQSIYDYSGNTPDGTVSYSQPPSDLNYRDASSDPTFYSFTEISSPPPGTPAAVANKNIIQDPTFPCEGWWAAAYDDLCVDFAGDRGTPVIDTLDPQGQRWKHYDQLDNGWFPLGAQANDGTCPEYPATFAVQPSAGSDPTTSTEPQTWPVRGAEQSINKRGFDTDVEALKQILRTDSVRNLYALGHGDPHDILYLGLPSSKPFQRYRFVFLDGCQTYSTPNFSKFGAVKAEVMGQEVAPGNNALTDTAWYRYISGLRPAAFMGHVKPAALFYKGADDKVHCIEAVANWHEQFISFWTVYRQELYTAKLHADDIAWINATGCSSCANPRPQQPEMPADPNNGNPIWWNPVTCLKIAGYQKLKFNEYNKAGDTW
jgi:hypothetical protein